MMYFNKRMLIWWKEKVGCLEDHMEEVRNLLHEKRRDDVKKDRPKGRPTVDTILSEDVPLTKQSSGINEAHILATWSDIKAEGELMASKFVRKGVHGNKCSLAGSSTGRSTARRAQSATSRAGTSVMTTERSTMRTASSGPYSSPTLD